MTALGFVVAAAVGTVARWQAGVRLPRPTGTLAVNVAGSFALGLLQGADAPTVTVVGVAGLGALTTFSTIAQELVELWERRPRTAALYAAATVIGGVGGAVLGLRLG